MLHENNIKAIANWKAEEYATEYRNYLNNGFGTWEWFSTFMPEEETDHTMYDFRNLCKSFHEMGF